PSAWALSRAPRRPDLRRGLGAGLYARQLVDAAVAPAGGSAGGRRLAGRPGAAAGAPRTPRFADPRLHDGCGGRVDLAPSRRPPPTPAAVARGRPERRGGGPWRPDRGGRCGAPLGPGAGFCGRCGTPVLAQAVPSPPVYRYAPAPPGYPAARPAKLGPVLVAGGLIAVLIVAGLVAGGIAVSRIARSGG